MNMKEKGGGIWEELEWKGEGRNILLNYNLNIMIIKDIPCMNLVFFLKKNRVVEENRAELHVTAA